MTKTTKKGTFMIKKWNRRQRLVLWLVLSLIFLAAVCIGGIFCGDAARAVSYTHLTLPTTPVACRSRWSPYH